MSVVKEERLISEDAITTWAYVIHLNLFAQNAKHSLHTHGGGINTINLTVDTTN